MVGENRVVLYIPRVGVGAGKYVAKIVKNDRVVLITRVSSSSAFDLVGRGLGADGADVFQGALSTVLLYRESL